VNHVLNGKPNRNAQLSWLKAVSKTFKINESYFFQDESHSANIEESETIYSRKSGKTEQEYLQQIVELQQQIIDLTKELRKMESESKDNKK
jgi:hypothetical protein